MSAADIHCQITEVYGREAMSNSKVRKCVRKFKDGRTNVHDEERSGRLSVITDDLMQAVEKKFIMATSGSSFTPTSLGCEDNVEVGQHPRAPTLQWRPMRFNFFNSDVGGAVGLWVRECERFSSGGR
ncbi:hypothetical protein TNCV_3567261 [Trichonephila clavipes]|nr:hypothetical protein TNCV_3567261 [Trichonephila clavipes]